MSATPRDLLKTRQSRVGEVLARNALKDGQANSQQIVSGLALAVGTPNTTVSVALGEVLLGQALVTVPAVVNVALTGADTGAGQFRKVLIEADSSGNLAIVLGNVAASQAAAVLPALTSTKIAVGYVEVPASFVVGTTVVTAGMLKQGAGTQVAYNA